eukprot:177845-Rhodomonas_salina.1
MGGWESGREDGEGGKGRKGEREGERERERKNKKKGEGEAWVLLQRSRHQRYRCHIARARREKARKCAEGREFASSAERRRGLALRKSPP